VQDQILPQSEEPSETTMLATQSETIFIHRTCTTIDHQATKIITSELISPLTVVYDKINNCSL